MVTKIIDAERFGRAGKEIEQRVVDLGIYRSPGKYVPRLEDGKMAYAEGNSIIGLEKFLGYYNKALNIAYSPSISMTTNFCTVKAFCRYVKESGRDAVSLDGETNEKYTKRSQKALDAFRVLTGVSGSFQFILERERKYKSGKGLGESAAVASATARALVRNVFGEEAVMDRQFVSRYSRFVSGSGTRASVGNIALWISYPGIPEERCYAIELPVEVEKLHMAAFPKKSEIQTADAHGLAVASPFYESWLDVKYDRLKRIINDGWSLKMLEQTAQEDMLCLNSVILSSGTFIQTKESIPLINAFLEFQRNNPGIYMTADTGPTIVVMSEDRSLIDRFKAAVPDFHIDGKIVSGFSKVPDSKDAEKAEEYFGSLL